MKALSLLFPLFALLWSVPAASAAESPADVTEITLQDKTSTATDKSAKKEKKEKKEKEVVRDPRKAAAAKKKEMKEQGVKKVRVSGPADWPKRVPVPKDTALKTISEENGKYVYESNNYRFESPVELTEAGQNMIGRLFECTYAANRAMSKVLPIARCENERTEENKFRVRLVRNESEYHAQGGPGGSAGVFKHQARAGADGKPIPLKGESDVLDDYVLVPLTGLGLDEQARMVKPDIDTHTIVHETTHQCFVLNNLPIWANEGWAEYVGYVPYMGEMLDFDLLFSQICHKAQQNASLLNCSFSLKDLLLMSQEEMYGYMGKGSVDTYTVSVMTMAFFVHLDGKRGLEAIKAYMKALAAGTPNAEAVELLIKPYGTEDKMQKAVEKAWKKKKINLTYKS